MGFLDSLKKIFNKEEESEAVAVNEPVQQVSLEIDEEDRVVVALAASIEAGKDKPNSHFHISRITRIK
jgi:hypothetical protein